MTPTRGCRRTRLGQPASHRYPQAGGTSAASRCSERHTRAVSDPELVLARLGGAARWTELTRHSPRRQLAAAVDAGRIVRVAGVYALPASSSPIVAAAVHNGVLTCVSAAEHAGVAVLDSPAHPHIGVPRSRGRSPSELRGTTTVVLHRGTTVSRGSRVPVVPLAEALARMLLCCRPEEALVAIDSALHQGRTTLGAIRRALPERAPTRPLLVLRRANSRAASPPETLARLVLESAGLRVEVGCPITRVGWVDLLVEGRVVVELDGFAYHSGKREFQEDRRRDRELVARGFTVLRFTYRDVVADPSGVVRAVRAALAVAAGRPQPQL